MLAMLMLAAATKPTKKDKLAAAVTAESSGNVGFHSAAVPALLPAVVATPPTLVTLKRQR